MAFMTLTFAIKTKLRQFHYPMFSGTFDNFLVEPKMSNDRRVSEK